MSWLILSAVCLARLLYLLRPVEYSRADETVHVRACLGLDGPPGAWWGNTPMRIGYFALGRAALWLRAKFAPHRLLHAPLAVLSTVAGGAACAAWMGHGWQAVLVVGTCPLMLGLGRRALADVPLVAVQCLALACPWPWVTVLLVVGMLTVKESSFSALPAMVVWACLEHHSWWPFPAGAAVWVLWPSRDWYEGWDLLRRRCWTWPRLRWLLPRNVRRSPNDYAARYCRGGWLRLVTDLCLVSTPALLGAAWANDPRLLAVAVLLAWYGVPWLDQQIRSCLLADVMIRIIAAAWWPVIVVVDAYVFYRIWWRGHTYDPTHANLAAVTGMQ